MPGLPIFDILDEDGDEVMKMQGIDAREALRIAASLMKPQPGEHGILMAGAIVARCSYALGDDGKTVKVTPM